MIFAGHGSQARDRNADEPDAWDETLLFHDARVGDVRDSVLVFGTQETNPVPWHLFAEAAVTRQGTEGGTLYRALDRFMRPGARNAVSMREGASEDTTWSMSSLAIRAAGY